MRLDFLCISLGYQVAASVNTDEGRAKDKSLRKEPCLSAAAFGGARGTNP